MDMIILVLQFLAWLTLTMANGICVNKLVTFNAGLMFKIPSADVRRQELIKNLQTMDSDVVCLQEIFNAKDVQDIVSSLETVFPFSYSALHNDKGKFDYSSWNFPPCSLWKLWTFKCVLSNCNISQPIEKMFECGIRKCNLWKKLNQECISCVLISGVKNALSTCFGSLSTDMNIPGLLLLTKRPLRNRTTVPFIPNVKQVLPRSMLVADVERFGTVACTHMTANLGSVFYEPDLLDRFTSYMEENAYEAQFIIDYFKHHNDIVLMGDLNTGPTIVGKNISGEFEGSYDLLISSGYNSPYVTVSGKGTYNDENPYTTSSNDILIDHVMYQGNYRTVAVKRILDKNIKIVGGPISDHYGVEVSLIKNDEIPKK